MNEVKTENKLKFKHKLGYSLGDAGGCLTFALMGSTFTMYCTDALGINEFLLAAPLICVTFIALWYVPQFYDGIALIVVLFCLKILYEATYTMFNIPMGSLLSAMSTNDAERASLSSARGIGSGIGNMLPAVIMPMLIANLGGNTNPTGYAVGSIVCAVIGLGNGFIGMKKANKRKLWHNMLTKKAVGE